MSGAPAGGKNRTKKKILVVEDDKEALVLLQKVLSKEYEVFTAGNRGQAMMMARKTTPDLVLFGCHASRR